MRFWDQHHLDFLLPNGTNFSSLIEKINAAFARLSKEKQSRAARRDIENFSYVEALADYEIPKVGLGFDQALEHSIEAFQGCINWHDPSALFNLTPTPLLDTVALSTLTSLYNPNALWDITAGRFSLLEMKVIKALSTLAGWDPRQSAGIFTSGGKATLMYAIKSGLNKSDHSVVDDGLMGQMAVITSASGHYSIESICNFLGIGKNNCIRLPITENGVIDLGKLRECVNCFLKEGRKIACIILNGGSTIDLRIDPITAVREIVTAAVKRHHVDYTPHIHLDSVISWIWLFLAADRDHYLELDPSDSIRQKIEGTTTAIMEVSNADSFAADFHKTGLCPYISSCYVARCSDFLVNLNDPQEEVSEKAPSFGDIRPFTVTFENSRSCTGIISAFHVMQRLGIHGFQAYLISLIEANAMIKGVIHEHFAEIFEILNNKSGGFELVFKIHFFNDRRPFSELFSLPPRERHRYDNICAEFFRFLCHAPYCRDNNVPFVGYIPRYRWWNQEEAAGAFLLYVRSPNLDRGTACGILKRLAAAVKVFEQNELEDDPERRRNSDGFPKVPPR